MHHYIKWWCRYGFIVAVSHRDLWQIGFYISFTQPSKTIIVEIMKEYYETKTFNQNAIPSFFEVWWLVDDMHPPTFDDNCSSTVKLEGHMKRARWIHVTWWSYHRVCVGGTTVEDIYSQVLFCIIYWTKPNSLENSFVIANFDLSFFSPLGLH